MTDCKILFLFIITAFCLLINKSLLANDVERCAKLKVNYSKQCGDNANLLNLKSLQVDECVEVIVNSRSLWNASGLLMNKGEQYEVSVDEGQHWCDDSILSDSNGWLVDDNDLKSCHVYGDSIAITGLKKIFIMGAEWFRRYPSANWFELVGVVANHGDIEVKQVSKMGEFKPVKSGEFCAYANDLNGFYSNNEGSMIVRVKRSK